MPPNPYAYSEPAADQAESIYEIEETPFGIWRRYTHPDDSKYRELTSHACFFGVPLLHFTAGVCPETGRRKTASGWIAVGRVSVGFLAIGQTAVGILTIGQASFGVVGALGQLAVSSVAVGQAALGVHTAVGQLAIGYHAVGQIGIGVIVQAMNAIRLPF